MLINKNYVSATPSSGSWSANTPDFSGAILLQIIVKPATNSTTFDFSLTDDNGVAVIDEVGITGELNRQVYIPLRGIYTKTIANSADEAHQVELVVGEVI